MDTLVSHLFHTRLGVIILVTNHLNLQKLYRFAVIEMESDGEGMNLTFHDCDGTEGDALNIAARLKIEIDNLVAETAKPIEMVVVPWQH